MADRAYPPSINNKLPPLVKNNEGKYSIKIPFDYTSFTTKDNLDGIWVKISESMSNYIIAEFCITWYKTIIDNYIDKINQILYINREISDLNVGIFYKIQIAFQVNGEKGYYSNYGISKCLLDDDFSIGIVELSNNNEIKIYNLNELTGYFTTKDLSEFPVKYEFNVYNNNTLVESSGVQIHNNSTLDGNEITVSYRQTYDSFKITKELEAFQEYRVEYKVYTNNGLEKICDPKSFSTNDSFPISFASEIKTEMDNENCCAKIFIAPSSLLGRHLKNSLLMTSKCKYQLFRSDNRTNFSVWENIFNFKIPNLRFNLDGTVENKRYFLAYVDYLLEQGVQYKYAVSVVFNDETQKEQRSPKAICADDQILIPDYETAYLYDKNFQLAIKYNPKISSFKTTKLEQKIDTLGGIYPYFSRNYNTNYKEFPISGLISLLTDDQKLFNEGVQQYTNALYTQYNNQLPQELTDEESSQFRKTTASEENPFIKNYVSTDLVGENFYKEREFKLKVLDWLNNGELKVFKSPGEGNYIVRLMNVSLAPENALGRMLHTFTCTAYEAAPYNLKSLIENNLFDLDKEAISLTGIQHQYVIGIKENDEYIFDLRAYKNITRIDFCNFALNAEIQGYNNYNNNNVNDSDLFLYAFQENFNITNDNFDILNLKKIIAKQNNKTGFIPSYLIIYTSEYEDSVFDDIAEIKYDKIKIKQIIGETYQQQNDQLLTELTIFMDDKFNQLTDDKQQSTYIEKIKFKERHIEIINSFPDGVSKEINLKFYPKRYFANPLYLYKYRDLNDEISYWSQDIYGIIHKYAAEEVDRLSVSSEENISFLSGSLADNKIGMDNPKYKNVKSITLNILTYIEIAYPVNKIIYTNEQSWRDDDKDNDILCGYYQTNNEGKIQNITNEDNTNFIPNAYYIGLNCYNCINTYNYNELNAKQLKTYENGKYFADRLYVLEDINGQREGI